MDRATTVKDKNGLQGQITAEAAKASNADGQVLVRFQNGVQLLLPLELLNRQADGNYQLNLSVEELQASNQFQAQREQSAEAENVTSFVFPVIEEQAQVHTQVTQTGTVQIHKTVQERVELIDELLKTEEVEIERIALNQQVAEAPTVRYEGETLIIPLLEEVLFVEKRLVLREEIRIKKTRQEVRVPHEVTLRQEQIEIERKPETSP